MKRPGVYKIENVITGDIYVGSTRDIPQRWREHKSQLRHHTHKNPILTEAWDKYGEDAFVMETLEPALDSDHRILLEQVWMDWLKPTYNRAPFAGTCKGMDYPQHWIEKQRARMFGNKYRSDWTRKQKEA
jgi:group I intron endonuclease